MPSCKTSSILLFILEIIALTKTVENFQKKKVGCIWIDGGTPAASGQQLVTDFQEKDYIKAAVVWWYFCYPLKREELD